MRVPERLTPPSKSKAQRSKDENKNFAYDNVQFDGTTSGSVLSQDMEASDTGNSAYDQAMKAYRNQDFSIAAAGFERVLTSDPGNMDARFYAAVAHLSLGNAQQSMPHLDAVLASSSSKKEDAQWYKSLAYLKLKNQEWNEYARHLSSWERQNTLDC